MSDIWSVFAEVDIPGAEAPAPTHVKLSPAPIVEFPEWDRGGFARMRLPIALKLGANTAVDRAAPPPSKTDSEANAKLWSYLRNKSNSSRANGKLVLNYFAERPDLIARVAKVRVGPSKLTDRLNAEFQGSFVPAEVGQLGGLVPLANANPQTPGPTQPSKAERQKLYRERCSALADAGDPEAIVNFALEHPNFQALIGLDINAMLANVALETPPALTWTPNPTYALSEPTREAVAATCNERWRQARVKHVLALKRSASALKAAETRRKHTEEKRLAAAAEAKLIAMEKRRAALPIALTARDQGPDALIALLASNEAARSLLRAVDGENMPPLILNDAESAVNNRQEQAKLDKKGIWRKDVQAQCPWLKDSEIERLYRDGHLKVLRTVEIKKQGRWIDARLYDPACVRMFTRQWIDQWRANGKPSAAYDNYHQIQYRHNSYDDFDDDDF